MVHVDDMLKLITRLKPYAGYLLVITTVLIVVVSSIPSIPTLKIQTGKSVIRLDYFIHFCEYGFLAFLAFLTFTGSNFNMHYPKLMLITFCVVCFALFDELHQKLIPGRAFNIKDIISDLAGIGGALVFSLIIFRMIACNRSTR